MLTELQIEELSKPLSKDNVAHREKGGAKLSYVEGWKVIEEANTIFGFDGWSRETIYCKQICNYDYNGKVKVGYEAKVRVTVNGVAREGTGTGSGIAKDLYDAIEGANKEAETDAMKRALMTFGYRFGLALYDKQQRNVEDESAKKEEDERRSAVMRHLVVIPQCSTGDDWEAYTDAMCKAVGDIKSFADFTAFREVNMDNRKKLKAANSDFSDQLSEAFKKKSSSMKSPPKAPLDAYESAVH